MMDPAEAARMVEYLAGHAVENHGQNPWGQDLVIDTLEEMDRKDLEAVAWQALWSLGNEHDTCVIPDVGLLAERDRLRAVVDALRVHRALNGRFWSADTDDEAVNAAEAEAQAWQAVVAALDQLDGTGDMGDGVTELGPDDAIVINGVVFTVEQIERLGIEAGMISAGGASTREGEGEMDASTPSADRGAGAANTGAPSDDRAGAGSAGAHPPYLRDWVRGDPTADELHERGTDEPGPLGRRLAEPGALPDRPLTFSERVRAFKEDLPPGDDAAQIIAAKAEGLRYQPPICHTCGQTQDLIRRFNSGNPMIHYEAMCGCDDEQQSEDMQAGLLPGREGDPADLVEGDSAGGEGGVGEGRGAGAGSAPPRGEVGAGVDHGSGATGGAAGDVRRVGGSAGDAPQPAAHTAAGVWTDRQLRNAPPLTDERRASILSLIGPDRSGWPPVQNDDASNARLAARVREELAAIGPVQVERDEIDGGWVAFAEKWPGCAGQGDERADAVHDLLAAISLARQAQGSDE